ncbi:MAG: hypothetical protein KF701_04605 [Anaerolineales bacterium]|nr:MAG: hypothetical protein KF701_04605 [Anaerolineales bacterium]
MADLETALEGAIALVQQGKSIDEALAQYPEHRLELQPLLTASVHLKQAGAALPAAAFKARGRANLEAAMAASRRRGGRSPLFKLAAGLAAVVLTLTTATTAMAQSALPGETLHPLKLYSEQVWRSLHSNPVEADLHIAQRRLEELLALDGDAARVPAALSAYAAALDVLRTDLEALPDRALSAQEILHGQRDLVQAVLEDAGTTVDEVFAILPTLDVLITANPIQVPVSTAVEQIQLVVPTIPTVAIPTLSVPVVKPDQPVISVGVDETGVSIEVGKGTIIEQLEDVIDNARNLFSLGK